MGFYTMWRDDVRLDPLYFGHIQDTGYRDGAARCPGHLAGHHVRHRAVRPHHGADVIPHHCETASDVRVGYDCRVFRVGRLVRSVHGHDYKEEEGEKNKYKDIVTSL